MEIKTEMKTLESRFFNSKTNGVISGERFVAIQGETYVVVQPHSFEGVNLKQGQELRLAFKNKKRIHYTVS